MTQDSANAFVASLLDNGARGYAAAAAERLLQRRPEAAQRFGDSAFSDWHRHLVQRLEELAAAVRVGEPRLFVADVVWSRRAFDSRGVPREDLHTSLECLAEVLGEELPEPARPAARAALDAALAALAAGPQAEPPLDSATTEGKLALSYVLALLEGDRRKAMSLVLSAVEDGLPGRRALAEVLSLAQREMGRMWHAGELSVAQEHFVTSTTESLIVLLAAREAAAEPLGRTVVAASAPGNAHDLGTRLLAELFDLAGWRVIHLGQDVPGVDLAAAVDEFQADLLVLSVALSTQLKSAAEAIVEVRSARPEAKVLVGGLAFEKTPELWRQLGADGYAADAESAVTTATELLDLG